MVKPLVRDHGDLGVQLVAGSAVLDDVSSLPADRRDGLAVAHLHVAALGKPLAFRHGAKLLARPDVHAEHADLHELVVPILGLAEEGRADLLDLGGVMLGAPPAKVLDGALVGDVKVRALAQVGDPHALEGLAQLRARRRVTLHETGEAIENARVVGLSVHDPTDLGTDRQRRDAGEHKNEGKES